MGRGTRLRSKVWIGALALILTMGVAGSAGALNIIGATMDHGGSLSRLSMYGSYNYLGTFDGSSDAAWANALGGGLGPFDAIVIGEGAYVTGLSGATRSNIASYVNSGGIVIVTGDHGGASDKLNAIFGYSTSSAGSGEFITSTLQAGAVGTIFASGPATLETLDGTDSISGNPGITLYSSSNGTDAFVATYGSGVVGFDSWDLCECGNPSGAQDDWYNVLSRLLSYQAAVPFVPTEWLIGLALLMLLIGSLALRRRSARSEI